MAAATGVVPNCSPAESALPRISGLSTSTYFVAKKVAVLPRIFLEKLDGPNRVGQHKTASGRYGALVRGADEKQPVLNDLVASDHQRMVGK